MFRPCGSKGKKNDTGLSGLINHFQSGVFILAPMVRSNSTQPRRIRKSVGAVGAKICIHPGHAYSAWHPHQRIDIRCSLIHGCNAN